MLSRAARGSETERGRAILPTCGGRACTCCVQTWKTEATITPSVRKAASHAGLGRPFRVDKTFPAHQLPHHREPKKRVPLVPL